MAPGEAGEEDIDILGEAKDNVKQEKAKERENKAVKHGLYGPDQFSEEDCTLAVTKAVEKQEAEESQEENNPSLWCSQCQVSTRSII